MFSIKKMIAAIILLPSLGLCFGQRTPGPLSFSSEDQAVADFVQLPQSVLALLLNDKEDFRNGSPLNLHCEDREEAGPELRPEILCRKLTLSSHAGTDYLVIGVGNLRGAHVVPFWLFHQDENGASLLFKTRSDQIEIMSKRFNGYPEVRSTWIQGAGALIVTNSFRFDGKAYVQFRKEKQHH
jgi:hypothetical protein